MGNTTPADQGEQSAPGIVSHEFSPSQLFKKDNYRQDLNSLPRGFIIDGEAGPRLNIRDGTSRCSFTCFRRPLEMTLKSLGVGPEATLCARLANIAPPGMAVSHFKLALANAAPVNVPPGSD